MKFTLDAQSLGETLATERRIKLPLGVSTLASGDRLEKILASVSGRAPTPEQLAQQRASFAIGNGNIEEDAFSRATATMMLFPEGTGDGSSTDKMTVQNVVRFDVEASVRQYELMIGLILHYTNFGSPHFVLTPEIILMLQAELAYDGGPQAGYRRMQVKIAGSDFGPIRFEDVPNAVEQLCNDVNQGWAKDALELAAYALWRLNWIHPFADGNGRTARALSYMILSIKLGGFLPGSPTIPEQLLQQRADYYDALTKSDRTYQQVGVADLSALRSLLNAMLVRQLEAMPAFSPEDRAAVSEIVDRRVRKARPDLVSRVFGSSTIEDRLWSLADHLVLQLGTGAAINCAESMYIAEGSPFPRLLATSVDSHGLIVAAGQRGLILRDRPLDASLGFALQLERDAAVIIERPSVHWQNLLSPEGGWEIEGALYILRAGRELTLARAPETFDLLLARHMSATRA